MCNVCGRLTICSDFLSLSVCVKYIRNKSRYEYCLEEQVKEIRKINTLTNQKKEQHSILMEIYQLLDLYFSFCSTLLIN